MSLTQLAANHLWQSTVFAAVAALLALALRSNRARARYWLWLAASVKFLIPFSALADLGASLGRWFVPAAPVSRVPFVMQQIVQPFALAPDAPAVVAMPAPAVANLLPALLLALWLCGFVAALLYGWTRWRRVAAAVRSCTPLTEGREFEAWGRLAARQPARRLPSAARADWQSARRMASCPTLVSSTAKLEPGVFGIFRPVLWLPAGIADRLEDAELEAILAHELCHIRRRDNLFSAIHMLVEAVFWFHPLVWWLGARLEEERERACDEAVVRMGGEPQIYAESILKVVEFYLASPVPCAAGVTGGELRKRIEGIMANHALRNLSLGQRLLLAAAALAALIAPVAVGVMSAPLSPAQSRGSAAAFPTMDAPAAAPSPPASGSAHAAAAQTPPAEDPVRKTPDAPALEFEVASVKRLQGDRPRTWGFSADPGMLRASNITLFQLIRQGYHLQDYQINGGPTWLNSDDITYDVQGKAGTAAGRPELMLMLQKLLADRFQLQFHWADKEMTVQTLVVGKNGPAFHEVPEPMPGVRRSMLSSTTMENLANMLQSATRVHGAPIFDRTGLQGYYDVSALDEYTRRPGSGPAALAEADPGESVSIFDIWIDGLGQLGLGLKRDKAPVRVFVVDHVNETPTGN